MLLLINKYSKLLAVSANSIHCQRHAFSISHLFKYLINLMQFEKKKFLKNLHEFMSDSSFHENIFYFPTSQSVQKIF